MMFDLFDLWDLPASNKKFFITEQDRYLHRFLGVPTADRLIERDIKWSVPKKKNSSNQKLLWKAAKHLHQSNLILQIIIHCLSRDLEFQKFVLFMQKVWFIADLSRLLGLSAHKCNSLSFHLTLRQMVVLPHKDRKIPISALRMSTIESTDRCDKCVWMSP